MTEKQQQQFLETDNRYKDAEEATESTFCKARGLPTYKGVRPYRRETIIPIVKSGLGVISYQILKVHDDEPWLYRQCSPYAGGVIAIHNKEVLTAIPIKPTGKIAFCEGFKTGVVIHEETGNTVFCTLSEASIRKTTRATLKLYPPPNSGILYAEVNALPARVEKSRNFALELGLPFRTITHDLKPIPHTPKVKSKPEVESSAPKPRRKVRRISGNTRGWNS